MEKPVEGYSLRDLWKGMPMKGPEGRPTERPADGVPQGGSGGGSHGKPADGPVERSLEVFAREGRDIPRVFRQLIAQMHTSSSTCGVSTDEPASRRTAHRSAPYTLCSQSEAKRLVQAFRMVPNALVQQKAG